MRHRLLFLILKHSILIMYIEVKMQMQIYFRTQLIYLYHWETFLWTCFLMNNFPDLLYQTILQSRFFFDDDAPILEFLT